MKEKEHQSIEWKELWQDEHLKWICGYANAYGEIMVLCKACDRYMELLGNDGQHLNIILTQMVRI